MGAGARTRAGARARAAPAAAGAAAGAEAAWGTARPRRARAGRWGGVARRCSLTPEEFVDGEVVDDEVDAERVLLNAGGVGIEALRMEAELRAVEAMAAAEVASEAEAIATKKMEDADKALQVLAELELKAADEQMLTEEALEAADVELVREGAAGAEMQQDGTDGEEGGTRMGLGSMDEQVQSLDDFIVGALGPRGGREALEREEELRRVDEEAARLSSMDEEDEEMDYLEDAVRSASRDEVMSAMEAKVRAAGSEEGLKTVGELKIGKAAADELAAASEAGSAAGTQPPGADAAAAAAAGDRSPGQSGGGKKDALVIPSPMFSPKEKATTALASRTNVKVRKGFKQMAPALRVLLAAAVATVVCYQLARVEALKPLWATFADQLTELFAPVAEQLSNPSRADRGLFDVIFLLMGAIVAVPLFQMLPGGSPVLGYLSAGAVIGPHAVGLISNVHEIAHMAEFGVIFLLFNIGLELSLERLAALRKFVFGLGSAMTLGSAALMAAILATTGICGSGGPISIVVGGGLAMSSTAVVMQVLAERKETQSRHGRVSFSVLLFQDLAVVVLLVLIPLLAPQADGSAVSGAAIAKALGQTAVMAVLGISAIMGMGRLVLRPLYGRIGSVKNNDELFLATTLLTVLACSVFTQAAGLSMALGAFLAGLLLAETEYVHQVEADIKPYKGLFLGLFFVTVGMSIDFKVLTTAPMLVVQGLGLIMGVKAAVTAVLCKAFGLTWLQAIRTTLLLAPGGEFAFVAFGEATKLGLMDGQVASALFLCVVVTMALTPYFAGFGKVLTDRFEAKSAGSLTVQSSEASDLSNHVIVCGFGRIGRQVCALLERNRTPFVVLDLRPERVRSGRESGYPIFFGDAASKDVLHAVGIERASAVTVTMSSSTMAYRTVWNVTHYFPGTKIFSRAHDTKHAEELRKAGADVVVPDTFEPALQLGSSIITGIGGVRGEVAEDDFYSKYRRESLGELYGTMPRPQTGGTYRVQRDQSGGSTADEADAH